jgi:hypothetical protein
MPVLTCETAQGDLAGKFQKMIIQYEFLDEIHIVDEI